MSRKSKWWRRPDGQLVTHRGRLALAVRNTRRRLRAAYLEATRRVVERYIEATLRAAKLGRAELDKAIKSEVDGFATLAGPMIRARHNFESGGRLHKFTAGMTISDELIEAALDGSSVQLARAVGYAIEREVLAAIESKREEVNARRAVRESGIVVERFTEERNDG